MSVRGRARCWNATAAEREARYPCDALVAPPVEGLLRAVDVAAPAPVAFRRLCQLTVAPYSYDWIDNLGRRSPRTLTPGADRLERGRRVMRIFDLVDFEPGRHLTMAIRPAAARVFGALAASYLVVPAGPEAARLVVKLAVSCPGPLARARCELLAVGDLVMMRKQLLTLAELAERDAGAAPLTAASDRGRR